MIGLLLVSLIALLVVRAALRRTPLFTLMCIGLVGFALHAGVVSLPSAIMTPVAHLTSALHQWQQRQSAALSCELAQASAIERSDQASLDRLQRLCGSARSANER